MKRRAEPWADGPLGGQDAGRGSNTVTPIRTATNTAGKAIKAGDNPIAIAIKR